MTEPKPCDQCDSSGYRCKLCSNNGAHCHCDEQDILREVEPCGACEWWEWQCSIECIDCGEEIDIDSDPCPDGDYLCIDCATKRLEELD